MGLEPSPPLRFPGSKARLVPFIEAFLQRNSLVGVDFVEACCGSAVVSLALLQRGLIRRAYINDIDPLVYSFWKCIFEQPDKFIRMVLKEEVSIRRFKYWRRIAREACPDTPRLMYAFCFLFLNRTSYSGIVGAGPIGGMSQSSSYPIDCRFNREEIARRIRKLSRLAELVTVTRLDVTTVIKRHSDKDVLVYVDPPYYKNGKKFYRRYFTSKNHVRLMECLSGTQAPWLLSYDYHPEVERSYDGFNLRTVRLYHSARGCGAKPELLVSNLALRDPRSGEEVAATNRLGEEWGAKVLI